MTFRQHSYKTSTVIIVGGFLLGYVLMLGSGRPVTQTYMIQGDDLTSLKTAVQTVGGEITHELGITPSASNSAIASY